MISENLTEGVQPSTDTTECTQLQRCSNDINEYRYSTKEVNISDTSFSQDLHHDQIRTAAAVLRIEEIKTLPILQNEPIENKVDFYNKVRGGDTSVAIVEGKAIHHLRSLTGLDPINVGSFGLGLSIVSSDIDLGIGVPSSRDFEPVCQKLIDAGFKYKQARDTRYISQDQTTKRFVFSKEMDGIEIDVSVYHNSDLFLLADGGFRCRSTMSENEKAEHSWNKFKLKEQGMIDDYCIYKLEPYITYKVGFKWVSIN